MVLSRLSLHSFSFLFLIVSWIFFFSERSICTSYETSLKTKFVESLINDLFSVMDKSVLDVKSCLNCKVPVHKITSFQNKLMTTTSSSNESSG